MSMLERALASGATPEVLERLLALQERWQANQAKLAFSSALASVRADLPPIIKNKTVDYSTSRGRTHYKHEDLSEIVDAIAPVLAKHGLSFRWRTASEKGRVAVTCILNHNEGHSEETTLSAPEDDSGGKNAIQAIGSAVTYLQRYTVKAALGIAASHDDDGKNAPTPASKPASNRSTMPQDAPQPKTKAKTPPNASDVPEGEFLAVCTVLDVTEKSGRSKKDDKPWTAWFLKLHDGFGELEAGTFSSTVADLARAGMGQKCQFNATIGPGQKAGTHKIVSFTPLEDKPLPQEAPREEPLEEYLV